MNDPRDCFQHGAAALSLRLPDQAERWARLGLEADADDGALWRLLGAALWLRGEVCPAREALESASILAPLCPLSAVALADCYLRTGKKEPARVCLMHLARPGLCPVDLLPRVAVGLGAVGEDAAALDVCRRILDQEPAHHAACFGVAYYLARLDGPAEDVIEALRQAVAHAPRHAVYRLNLAWSLACVGRTAEAAAVLRLLPEGATSCPFWLARMAEVFAAAGDAEREATCREHLAALLPFA